MATAKLKFNGRTPLMIARQTQTIMPKSYYTYGPIELRQEIINSCFLNHTLERCQLLSLPDGQRRETYGSSKITDPNHPTFRVLDTLRGMGLEEEETDKHVHIFRVTDNIRLGVYGFLSSINITLANGPWEDASFSVAGKAQDEVERDLTEECKRLKESILEWQANEERYLPEIDKAMLEMNKRDKIKEFTGLTNHTVIALRLAQEEIDYWYTESRNFTDVAVNVRTEQRPKYFIVRIEHDNLSESLDQCVEAIKAMKERRLTANMVLNLRDEVPSTFKKAERAKVDEE